MTILPNAHHFKVIDDAEVNGGGEIADFASVGQLTLEVLLGHVVNQLELSGEAFITNPTPQVSSVHLQMFLFIKR